MNEPGSAFAILRSAKVDGWNKIGEDTANHSFHAHHQAINELYCELNFSHANINGSVEFLGEDVTLDDIARNNTFQMFNDACQEFLSKFNTYELSRAGIRFFIINKINCSVEGAVSTFNTMFLGNALSLFENTLGKISDNAICIEGQADDEILYRVNFGPLNRNDTILRLSPSGSLAETDFFIKRGYNSICDIDLYENNLLFKGFNLIKWAKTKISKASTFMTSLSSSVASK
jgi:hypothetical protein